MNTKAVKVAGLSNDTILDISMALINDMGLNKTDNKYLIKLHKDSDQILLDLLSDGNTLKTLSLAIASGPLILNTEAMKVINAQAEKMFREDTIYGIKDSTGADRIIGSIQNSYDGNDFFPGVIKKATAYWFKFATSQMFFNGNKRTALMSGLYFLAVNGFSWPNINGNELYSITVAVANKNISQSELESYIRGKTGLQYFSTPKQALDNSTATLKFHFTIDNPNINP